MTSEKNIAIEFGKYIRDAREKKGLSQEEMANELGISRSYYAMIETGRRNFSFKLAIKFHHTLDLSIDAFADQTNLENPKK